MQVDLVNGKIGRSIIYFSIPMILGNLLQQLYNVADTLIVGKLIGANALAAVGSAYALMVLITSVLLGICMGSGVVFARFFGSGQMDKMKMAMVNAFVFLAIICFLLTALSFVLLSPIIKWLHIPVEAAAQTKEYLWIIFWGIPFVGIYNFFANVLRSSGNTVAALLFLAVAAITNIILDIYFIVEVGMGIKGAALATVIAQILSASLMSIYFFQKSRHLVPSKAHFKYRKDLLSQVMQSSFLTAVQQSIMNFGILLVQGLVNSFGVAVAAAFATVVKIDSFAYMPAQDFGNAFATYVAQNNGANQKERIKKGLRIASSISVLFCIVVSFGVVLFAKELMLLFLKPTETEIIRIGVEYLRVVGVFYCGIGLLFLWYGFYRGMEKAVISVVLTVVSLGSRVFLAYFLSGMQSIGILGIWWAVPIGWAIADIVGFVLYHKDSIRKYKSESGNLKA